MSQGSVGERIAIEQSIAVGTDITTDTTTNGAAVDTAGYASVAVVVAAGVLADGNYAITVQDSADGSTDWTDIDATEQTGTFTDFTSSNDEDDQWVGVIRPARRYLRAVVTSTSVTTGGPIAAFVVLADPQNVPTAHGVA